MPRLPRPPINNERRKQMHSIRKIPPLLLVLVAGCATPVPVAVTCPPQPPVPAILMEPASVGPSLSERYNALMEEFRQSLRTVIKDE
jgi:hypothetical protein